MVTATTEARPYLRPRDRRRQLLDAAGRVFDRSGYEGLTMVALAAEAGVSRRLVYDHFPDLGTLYNAFFDDRVAGYLARIDDAVARAAPGEGAAFAAAFGCLVAMPATDQQVIRLVAAGTGRAELEAVRARFRAHIERRWLPAVSRDGDDRRQARARLWALTTGVLGLAELVARGEASAATATAVATDLVAAVAG